jgi:hypothetical protein
MSAPNSKAPDTRRLNRLVKEHGLTLKIEGDTYTFHQFTAHGLPQALAYAEGFNSGYDQAQDEAFLNSLDE